LHTETGLTYSDIFGKEIKYTRTETESRGPILDKVLGPKTLEIQEMTRGPGMRAQTLQRYLDLLEEHNERKEKEHQRNQLRQQARGKKGLG